MANPRQRRKAKSSAHKAVSHSKRAKRLLKKMPAIRGPKTLQDAWDSSKTLRQNYVALGLVHDLNPIPSGGSEVDPSRTLDQPNTGERLPGSTVTDSLSVSEGHKEQSAPGALAKGFGRIIRDSTGNVVRVELPTVETESTPELELDAPVKMTESELRIWTGDHPATWQGSGGITGSIVRDLENIAACVTARKRHTSLGEKMYLERLVKKHGDDLEKMARDRRLNPAQRTANELRRAIEKARGLGMLCAPMDPNVMG